MKLIDVSRGLSAAGFEHVLVIADETETTAAIHFHSASERAAQRRDAKRYRASHRAELKRYAQRYQKHRKTHRADPARSRIAQQVARKYR